MHSIEKFSDFLRKHFHFVGTFPSNKNVIKCGVEAVKLGLLHKDCVNRNGDCLAVILLEYAVHSVEQEACMPFLDEFFAMKPCLRKVLASLLRYELYYELYGDRFVKLCMPFEYLWTDRLTKQHWWAMPISFFSHKWNY